MNKQPVTSKGMEKIREQLRRLKAEDRPQVTKAIAEARAHGDLSENAEYHAARERQGMVEAKITLLENAIAQAQVIDVSQINADGKVIFGATVELLRLENEQTLCYQIVGEVETDTEAGKISVHSPLARALIGKREGDVVEVQAPGGQAEYELLKIRYE